MELFIIYLWLKLDSVISMTGSLQFLFAIGTFIFTFIVVMITTTGDGIAQLPVYKRLLKVFIALWVMVTTLTTLLPTTKEMTILVGSYFGIELVKSPEAQKAWTLMRGKANELLDEEIKKLNPAK